MLDALDANPGRWDISSLVIVLSSGVMWSEATKQGLLRHRPAMMLVDVFSSSEALGMGQSISGGTERGGDRQVHAGRALAGAHRRRARRGARLG